LSPPSGNHMPGDGDGGSFVG